MSGIVGTSSSKSKVVGKSLDTAKAWVSFNGTGTVAILNSFNVSSITDNSTGEYTANFTSAMPNANYVFSISGRISSWYTSFMNSGTRTTTQLKVGCSEAHPIDGTGSGWDDNQYMCITIYGD